MITQHTTHRNLKLTIFQNSKLILQITYFDSGAETLLLQQRVTRYDGIKSRGIDKDQDVGLANKSCVKWSLQRQILSQQNLERWHIFCSLILVLMKNVLFLCI